MSSGYSKDQLLEAKHQFELAADLLALAVEDDALELTMSTRALDAADEAYDTLGVSSQRE